MNTINTRLQVRVMSVAIIIAAIVASFIVAMHLRPGNPAGAAEINQPTCAICIKSGGIGQGGTVGSPAGTPITGGLGGASGK